MRTASETLVSRSLDRSSRVDHLGFSRTMRKTREICNRQPALNSKQLRRKKRQKAQNESLIAAEQRFASKSMHLATCAFRGLMLNKDVVRRITGCLSLLNSLHADAICSGLQGALSKARLFSIQTKQMTWSGLTKTFWSPFLGIEDLAQVNCLACSTYSKPGLQELARVLMKSLCQEHLGWLWAALQTKSFQYSIGHLRLRPLVKRGKCAVLRLLQKFAGDRYSSGWRKLIRTARLRQHYPRWPMLATCATNLQLAPPCLVEQPHPKKGQHIMFVDSDEENTNLADV
jgi:hypothetical protein